MNEEKISKPEAKTSSQQEQQLFVKIGITLLFLLSWLLLKWLDGGNEKSYGVFIWFFPYVALLTFLSLFTKYRLVKIIHSFLSIPGLLLIATGPFVQTIASIIFTYVMILGGTTIAVFIIPKEIFNYQIHFTAGIYLVLSASSIIATTFSEYLIKSWHNSQNKDYKEFSNTLSIKAFGQQKVRFMIFTLYFTLVVVFTFSSLNKVPILKYDNIDIAILQSFATYVAFDRLISNWKAFKQKKSQL